MENRCHWKSRNGLRQGLLLLNLALEKVIKKAGVTKDGTIFFKPIQIMSYADDSDIIATSLDDLKEVFIKIDKTARRIGYPLMQRKYEGNGAIATRTSSAENRSNS